MTRLFERYLGDGLYAHFDGYHVILRAPRDGGDHWVGLEPGVLRCFQDYIKYLYAEIEAHNKRQQELQNVKD